MLLILDLDETLLHSMERPSGKPADFEVGPFHVYLRPHLSTFLAYASQHFQLAAWTSASTRYGREVCRNLFPFSGQLEFVWCCERCTLCYDVEQQERYWVKDFKKLRAKGYDLAQVLVIDDTPKKHERNYGNLIRISPFTGNADDRELLWLCTYLEELRDVGNVRKIDKRNWQEHFCD